MIFTEMDRKLPVKNVKMGDNKAAKAKVFYKPFWSHVLQDTWNVKVNAERKWLSEKKEPVNRD